MLAAALLQARLHDAIVPPRRGDHLFTLADVVRDGLFDVDVFAGLARQERHRRVPVVGRGDHHGVDRAVVEQAAEVGFPTRHSAGDVGHSTNGSRPQAFVDVAEGDHFDIAQRGESGRQHLALVTHADRRDADPFGRPTIGRGRLERSRGQARPFPPPLRQHSWRSTPRTAGG